MAIKGVIKDFELKENDSYDDMKREIIVASTAGNIISKYTSFVGVDKMKNEKIGETETYLSHFAHSPYYGPSNTHGMNFTSQTLSLSDPVNLGVNQGQIDLALCELETMPYERQRPMGHFMRSSAAERSSDLMQDSMSSYCAMPRSQETGKASTMVRLQEFDGSWSLTEELAFIVNISKGTLEEKAILKDTKVWATAVAVCWLTSKCPDERSEWEMVVNKAKHWLVKQLTGWSEVDKLLKDVKESLFSA